MRNGRRRPSWRRWVAALLALAAFVAVFVALSRGDSTARPATATAAATTPMWSVRRVPEPVVDAVGAQHLQAALDAAAPGDGTCFVVATGDHVIASHNADTPLIPASTQKLVVGAAALSILGPDVTLTTRVVAPAAPQNGAVDRLWLVGGGDPGLSTADYRAFLQSRGDMRERATTSLEALADDIVAKGVRHIPGGIVGDDSRYDEVRRAANWSDSYLTDGEISYLSALTVNGGYVSWSPDLKTPADNPTRNAAVLLTTLLRDRGVDVGAADTGTAPPNAVDVAQIASPPLHSIVASMLVSSDNLAAELLTKEIGLKVSRSGSTAAGLAAITAKMKELGVPIADHALTDGSGLDRGNHLTCDDLLAVLRLADRPGLAALQDGLPVAGQSGTLYDQFIGQPVAGRLRAKTGTLNSVTALAGLTEVGRELRFAFVDNGDFTRKEGDAIHQRVGEIVGAFPDAPAVDALVPAPQ